MAEREPQPMQRSIGALELVCGAKALLVPSERLGVVTFVLSEAALLEAQARERLGVGAEVIPSLLVRLPRAGVVAAELEHVGEALPPPADLRGCERLHLRRDLERAPEELGGVGVGELRPAALGGDQREAPCLLG